jgi:DHA2 family multidrug resistance protein
MLVIWVGALQIMLDTGKDADWFSSPAIVVEALVAAVGFAAWLIWELGDDHPVVDLTLFRHRNFTLGTIAFCLGYAVFFANVLLLPLWLQTNVGYTATWAGLVAAPSGVVAVLLTPLAARFMARVDARLLATVAFAAFAVSYFMRADYTETAGFWDFVWPLAVQGVAVSTFFVAMLTISLDGIAPERIPSASGISNFARITAGGFAASITTTLWDRREALHQSRLADWSSAYSPAMRQALDHLHRLGFADPQAYAVLARSLTVQAYTMASDDLFWISGWLSIAMIAVVWLARRSVSGGGAQAAAD